MSDAKGGGDWKDKIPPGGLIVSAALAAAVGIWAILTGLGAGIMNFGDAKRHYPEVVMGAIAIGFAIAAFSSSRSEKKDEHAAAPKKEEKPH